MAKKRSTTKKGTGEPTAPLRAQDIAHALTLGDRDSPWFLKKLAGAVASVSWGFFAWGEADLIAVSQSMYITEIEIKISYHDFVVDSVKKKFHKPRHINARLKDIKSFYYAAPADLARRILEEAPPDVGVVAVHDVGRVEVLRRSVDNRKAAPLTQERLMKLLRLSCFRAMKALARQGSGRGVSTDSAVSDFNSDPVDAGF